MTSFFDLVYLPRNPQIGDGAASQYRIVCRCFDSWSGGRLTIQSLTPDVLCSYLKHAAESGEGRSPRTINNRRQMLVTMWKWAFEEKMADHPPPSKRSVPKLREPRRQPNAFTMNEMRLLKRSCLAAPQIPRFRKALWTGTHWWLLCSLIWDTAHRVSALLSTPRDAVDREGYLRVQAEDTKHLGEMVHALKQTTLDLINQIPESPSGLLLDWPYQKRQLWIRFERDVLIPSGLPFDNRHKFHCLRRTSASHLYAATGDIYAVMRHLGHRQVETTWKYIDTRIGTQQKSAAELLDEI